MKKSLIVEGWRFLPHSYAVVNQWQLLSLLRRPGIAVKVVDAPFFNPDWRVEHGLFDEASELALKGMGTATQAEAADITLRIFSPMDFSSSPSRQTAVFGTSESQTIRKEQIRDAAAFENAKRADNVRIVTPSRWSAEGFCNSGFSPARISIVPLGVDPLTFRPMPQERARIRGRLSLADGDFAFFHVGAMSWNKGIDVLLKAFSEVNRKFPDTRLVLKGSDALYQSKHLLLDHMQKIAVQDRERVKKNLRYSGEALSNKDMALLYQAADAYVSPYRAEGFNIPVLEAAACGIPVLCTRGGPTDDFVIDAFARKIDSVKTSARFADADHGWVEPNVDHLISLMTASIEDASWRQGAFAAGPAHAHQQYNWDSVVEKLIAQLWN